MAVTLYLRILTEERVAYEGRGWKFVCSLWPVDDRKQCLVKKNVTE
jgi:hypothetical protein